MREYGRRKKRVKDSAPVFAALELCYECNHHCRMCSNVWKNSNMAYPVAAPLSTVEWFQVIDVLIAHGVREFALTGGEPSLYPGFPDVCHYLANRSCLHPPLSFSVLTNGDGDVFGTAFSKELGTYHASVSVALLGNKEIHERITGGCFERTVQTILNLVAAEIDVIGNITLLPENIEIAEDIVKCGVSLGIKKFVVMRALPVGAAASSSKSCVLLPIDALRSSLRSMFSCAPALGATVTLGALSPYCLFSDIEDTRAKCGCGTSTICVDPSGRLRPCTTSSSIGGIATEILTALNSTAFREFRNIIDIGSPRCQCCPHRSRCSGGCPAAWVDCPGSSDLEDIAFQL